MRDQILFIGGLRNGRRLWVLPTEMSVSLTCYRSGRYTRETYVRRSLSDELGRSIDVFVDSELTTYQALRLLVDSYRAAEEIP